MTVAMMVPAAVVVTPAVLVAMVLAVIAVAAVVSMSVPVRGRGGRQEREGECCRERRRPDAPARCVSVTQGFLLIP